MSGDFEGPPWHAYLRREIIFSCCNGAGRPLGLAAATLIASMTLAGCAADTTNGICTVGGVQRACHTNGIYKNKYHLNGQHAGTCACQ